VTSDLAARLGVAPASVTGMVRRLADQELLTYTPYRGVRLTAAGRRAALTTLRRHRVIEAYLSAALGVPADRLHAEAERLEHAALGVPVRPRPRRPRPGGWRRA
jgi:DtxR family Mn-dependent transcriptional regulator